MEADDSYFASEGYVECLVIADGAHVIQTGLACDLEALVSHMCNDEKGPRVPRKGERGHVGWYWVGGEDDRLPRSLTAIGFQTILYKNVQGRQSGRVDAKIQSLLARIVQPGTKKIILLSGDGDHAGHLMLGSVDLWVYAWRGQLSTRLRKAAYKTLYLDDIEADKSFDADNSIVRAKKTTRTLDRCLHEIIPEYDRGCGEDGEAIFRTPGMQSIIYDMFKSNVFVGVVGGETGCGKSTMLPQVLLDVLRYQNMTQRDVRSPKEKRPVIFVAQPKRLSCRTLVERVRGERSWKRFEFDFCGKPDKFDDYSRLRRLEVGHAIGGESSSTASTSVVYCTYGVLLKILLHESTLPWDVLILDEAHEQSAELSLIVSLLPPLLSPLRRVFIVSATLTDTIRPLQDHLESLLPRKDLLKHYSLSNDGVAGSPSIARYFRRWSNRREGYTCDVKRLNVEFLRQSGAFEMLCWHRRGEDADDVLLRALLKIAKNSNREGYKNELVFFLVVEKVLSAVMKKSGAVILVFLPGLAQIRRMEANLTSSLALYREAQNEVFATQNEPPMPEIPVYILHSSVPREKQLDAVLSHGKPPIRIILTNNVAETGVTIPDATYVVDLCKQKQPMLRNADKHPLVHTLVNNTGMASRDAVIQRKGRVGRTSDGECMQILTDAEFNQLPAAQPGLRTDPLDTFILSTACGGWSFSELLTKCPPTHHPHPDLVDLNVERLMRRGVMTPDGRLTERGRFVADLPFDFVVSDFVYESFRVSQRLGQLACIYAVADQGEVVFKKPETLQQSVDVGKAKTWFSKGFASDVVVYINALRCHSARGEVEDDHCKTLNPDFCQESLVRLLHVYSILSRHAPLSSSPEPVLLNLHRSASHDSLLHFLSDIELTNRDCTLLMILHSRACRENTLTPTAPAGEGKASKFHFELPKRNLGKSLWWKRGDTTSDVVPADCRDAIFDKALFDYVSPFTKKDKPHLQAKLLHDYPAGWIGIEELSLQVGIGWTKFFPKLDRWESRFGIPLPGGGKTVAANLEKSSIATPAYFEETAVLRSTTMNWQYDGVIPSSVTCIGVTVLSGALKEAEELIGKLLEGGGVGGDDDSDSSDSDGGGGSLAPPPGDNTKQVLDGLTTHYECSEARLINSCKLSGLYHDEGAWLDKLLPPGALALPGVGTLREAAIANRHAPRGTEPQQVSAPTKEVTVASSAPAAKEAAPQQATTKDVPAAPPQQAPATVKASAPASRPAVHTATRVDATAVTGNTPAATGRPADTLAAATSSIPQGTAVVPNVPAAAVRSKGKAPSPSSVAVRQHVVPTAATRMPQSVPDIPPAKVHVSRKPTG